VGQPAIVPEFQGYPGIKTLAAANSFSEKGKIHKPKKANKDDWGPWPHF
jgi:hypothetical protein